MLLEGLRIHPGFKRGRDVPSRRNQGTESTEAQKQDRLELRGLEEWRLRICGRPKQTRVCRGEWWVLVMRKKQKASQYYFVELEHLDNIELLNLGVV